MYLVNLGGNSKNLIVFIFHIKVLTMRIKLMLAALLFLLPSNISGSKEDKISNIETENRPNIDASNGLK